MKVLFISFEYPPRIMGGAGTYAESLVKGFEERGVDVRAITEGEMRIDQNHGIFAPNASHWRRFHFTKQALSLSGSGEFDLVHFNGLYPIIRNLKLPTVGTLHSSRFARFKTTLQESRRLETVEKNIMNLALRQPALCLFNTLMVRAMDKIICPSPSLARELSYHLVDNRKIHVIPNGIDLKRFDRIEASANGLSKEYSIEKDNFILYVGRLSPVKGVEYLVEAFRNIRKEFPKLKLVIVGSGEYEPYLRNLARDTEGVLFVGFVSVRVQKFLYENSLALVVPSLHETFPFVPLEGMACSKPIIATDVGGVHLMVRHGMNGFLVRPRDPTDLAEFIALLGQNPDLRRKMGKCGRRIVEKEFTASKMVSETLKVYKLLS